MRRVLASIWLALLSFPLIAQIALANNAPDLPACCRRDGKHHCAMSEMAGSAEMPGGPALKAVQLKCPLFPKAEVVPSFSKTVVLQCAARIGAPRLAGLTTIRPEDTNPRIASRASVRKRGPPATPGQNNQIL